MTTEFQISEYNNASGFCCAIALRAFKMFFRYLAYYICTGKFVCIAVTKQ